MTAPFATPRAVDVHALPAMLTALRLPSFHRHWPMLAERADTDGWPAARFLAALAEKVRDGALILKRYHAPLTPHQRLVADPRVPQPLKDALEAQYATLDPVSLLRDIRAAQRTLVEIADTAPVVPAGVPPLETFVGSLKVAWRSTEEVRPTTQPKPSKPRYRTVPDPLEGVTEALKAWFDADPGGTGRQLLDRLQLAHPGAYPDCLIRTVQRRLKIWRRESARALVLGGNDTVSASGARHHSG